MHYNNSTRKLAVIYLNTCIEIIFRINKIKCEQSNLMQNAIEGKMTNKSHSKIYKYYLVQC